MEIGETENRQYRVLTKEKAEFLKRSQNCLSPNSTDRKNEKTHIITIRKEKRTIAADSTIIKIMREYCEQFYAKKI